MSIVTKEFLLVTVPYLTVSIGFIILNLAMFVALLGYGIEALRPLYVKLFRINVLSTTEGKDFAKAIGLTIFCTAITILLNLTPVKDFLLFQYYKLFGGV